LAKIEEKKKIRNSNLIKSFDNLINKPKQFIIPKMTKIIEEIEIDREFDFKNNFKQPLYNNSIIKNDNDY
jgi:hypothetical protein